MSVVRCESVCGYELEYDKKVERAGYVIPEVLFGLMFDFVNEGENLLDIGVGTGRVAKLFRKVGLRLHGLDRSAVMLELAETKVEFASLKGHDLLTDSYPYNDESMQHITCAGVLNHIRDLSVFFKECSRILKNGGYFAFMTGYREDGSQVGGVEDSMSGHTDNEVNKYLKDNFFELERSLGTSVTSSMNTQHIKPVKIYVAKKVLKS